MGSAAIVALCAASDIGLVRQRNEDSYRCDDALGLWLVADGMGGPGGGEIASRLAAEAVTEAVLGGRGLIGAAEIADRAIAVAASAGAGRPGMGTTLVALRATGGPGGADYELCWVGDSRAYLWDGAGLTRLSHDHSLVQEMVDAGEITAAAARLHPQRNIVTHVLGGNMPGGCGAEAMTGTLAPGHSILLCTDGLTGELDDAEIGRVLGRSGPGAETAEALIAAANERGGADNVTVVLVGYSPSATGSGPVS